METVVEVKETPEEMKDKHEISRLTEREIGEISC
jgi:hypothetical protein